LPKPDKTKPNHIFSNINHKPNSKNLKEKR
jgi:hypothetical protein